GERVDAVVVHGKGLVAPADGGGEEGAGAYGAAPAADAHPLFRRDAEAARVVGVDLHVAVTRVEFAEDGGFSRAGVGVPLRGGAPSRQQGEGLGVIGRLDGIADGVEEEPGFAVGGVKPAAVILCGEQPALGRLVFGVTGPVWPLGAAGLGAVAGVAD